MAHVEVGHVTITQTARRWCPLSLTFHVPTHSGLGSPTGPCRRQPTRHNQTHCHTPGPRRSSPTHPDTPPRSRLSHAQRVPGPWDKSWLHPGIHTPGGGPGRALATPSWHTPPTCLQPGTETCRLSTFLLRARCPCPAPRTPFRGGRALLGQGNSGPQPAAGAGPGIRGAPLPSLASVGSQGQEGSRGGSLGSG